MNNPQSSTILIGTGLAYVVYHDVRNGSNPFIPLFYGGLLLVIVSGISNFSSDLATMLAVTYLILAVIVKG